MCCVKVGNNCLPIIILNNDHIWTSILSSEGVVCVFKSYFLETYFHILFVNEAQITELIFINMADKTSSAVAGENIGVGA